MTAQAETAPLERRAYSVEEFARMFGFSRKHAYELQHRGLIRFKKIGAKTVVLRDEIVRFESSLDDA